jgi:hypothetical protein
MQEAEIQQTPEGQVPVDGGWFILNLGEMAWETVPGFEVCAISVGRNGTRRPLALGSTSMC